MKNRQIDRFVPLVLASVLTACGGGGGDAVVDASSEAAAIKGAQDSSLVAPLYALDFVAPAASGSGLNEAGVVIGRSYPDPGCGPFCLPPQEIVAWRGGERIVLPPVAGHAAASHHPLYINSAGTIAGLAGIPGSSTRAVLWKPEGTGYVARDLGVYPGSDSVEVFGLDDQDRMVGWATRGGAIPSLALPFMWSAPTGMVDLRALGYPNERPAAMSRGGKVVTWGSWYQLGDPASARALPPLPQGYVGAGSNGSAINDFADQAHFLVSISTQSLVYPFRLAAGGQWQQLSSAGTGRLSRASMGSISDARDVTFTALGTGMVAPGPAGVGQALAGRISPAYPGAAVADAGPMNARGQVLAQVMIGRSQRLVKLAPATACASGCLVARSLALTGRFVEDPALPGQCVQGGRMYNAASVSVTITDEHGVALPGVQVSGRFLDDYWTNRPLTGTTDASGVVSWTHKGPCGVGAIAFLVEQATLASRVFDRTQGVLTGFVIPTTAGVPEPTPAPGVAPVAVANVSCTAGRGCAFDASGSHDPDGRIAAYRWTDNKGTVWSTQPVFTRSFAKAGRESVVLQVTDDAGLVASRKVMFTVLR